MWASGVRLQRSLVIGAVLGSGDKKMQQIRKGPMEGLSFFVAYNVLGR